MHNFYSFKKNSCGFIVGIFLLSSCANIIPPSGGAKDTLAPILIAAYPKDSSINFASKKIILTFNEYVEAKEIQQNLLVNPLPKNQPIVDYKLHNVYVTLKDSLEPNTTYSINFGNAIKDVNEGNAATNKTYIFSTGKTIDYNSISGRVILAKDGKIDSTLIVVLHPNLNDSAVIKLKPKYLERLDGNGNFKFNNLPNTAFNIYVLPNDYSKKYDDSTKLFGFLNNNIVATDTTKNIVLYAYKEAELLQKIITQKLDESNATKEDKRLKYTTTLLANKFDVLDTALQISFNRKIIIKSKAAVTLFDTSYNPINDYNYSLDSLGQTISLKNKFSLNTNYILLLNKDAFADTNGITLSKSDTIKLATFKEADYGNIKLRISTKTTNTVLQIVKDGKLRMSIPITSNVIKQQLFKPGEYELYILQDENNNGLWDTGNYKQKRQPEKVIPIKNKLLVKANWDNEMDISW